MTAVRFELEGKDDLVIENVENLTGPTGTFMYWQIVLADEEKQQRKFLHERYVNAVHVEGEEQIIETASRRMNNSQELAKTLGLEQ